MIVRGQRNGIIAGICRCVHDVRIEKIDLLTHSAVEIRESPLNRRRIRVVEPAG